MREQNAPAQILQGRPKRQFRKARRAAWNSIPRALRPSWENFTRDEASYIDPR